MNRGLRATRNRGKVILYWAESTIAAPRQHASGTVATYIRRLAARSWLADGVTVAHTGVSNNLRQLPSWHHGSTQWAPTWLHGSTHDCICYTNCIGQHHHGANSVRWRRTDGPIVASSQHAHWTQLSPKNPCPQCKTPFFVLRHAAQRMGPLGQISGEIGHSGILRTEPFILTSKATPSFAATCRVAATRGLGA